MRDDSYSDEQIALAQELHVAGLERRWVPGDRLIGGERPIRVVRSVSVEGEPLVEVERGGRLQTVGVAHPRIWLPTVDDALHLLGVMGFEGALMFRRGRVALKYRLTASGSEYRLQSGDSARAACYGVLLIALKEGHRPDAGPPPAGPTGSAASARTL